MQRTSALFASLSLAVASVATSAASAEGILAVGTDTGMVSVFDKANPKKAIATFRPFATQTRVSVAAGDVNGDGIDDLIVGAGPGGGPHVRVFSSTGQLQRQLTPYPGFNGGVSVAVGDVNGDGVLDIITAPGASGGSNVRAYSIVSGEVLVSSYQAFEPGFTGGVFVASGDVNGDGFADIIVSSATGSSPSVRVFDGYSSQLTASFFAYDPLFRGGVRVATGDVNGDGTPDIIVGAGPGSAGGHVKVFDGVSQAQLASFFAFDSSYAGGVNVAGDSDDGGTVFVTPSSPSGGNATVRIFKGDANVSWLMPLPGYVGGLSIGASSGAMDKAPARPNMPGGLKITETW